MFPLKYLYAAHAENQPLTLYGNHTSKPRRLQGAFALGGMLILGIQRLGNGGAAQAPVRPQVR